ncbi:MAG: PAS domain-containing protein [Thermoleophilaceae bacterium]
MRVAPELERLLERADDPAFLLDPANDRILSANRAACLMLGFTRDQLLATPISHVHPAEMPQLLDFVERVLRNGHGSTITLTCRTKCGDFLPTEMALFALAGGAETHILALVQDRCQHRQCAGPD